MKFKGVENLTGKELCEIEDILFPLVSEIDENSSESEQKRATVDIVKNHGEQLVKICYTSDNNEAITEINEPYRVQLIKEAIVPIMKKLFSGGDEGKSETKAKKIQPR